SISQKPELAQAPGMATGLGGYLPAGDGWPELPREANKSKDRRTRAGHRSDGQSDPDMANDEGERDYSGLFAGSSESVAVLLQEVRDKLLAGDEEGATLGLIRLIRNNQDVCGELEAELGSLPPNSLACAIRALLVCGEREHAKALLGHAASLHPRDSRPSTCGRLID
ncbi:MAG: hypothetical protein M1319_07025, partial [Chloroflexi bacterium]|nr:hypothetical protein [Chloroflexota bacterium]